MSDEIKWPAEVTLWQSPEGDRDWLADTEDCADPCWSKPYIHRDAARAWQHVRDFLNGSPEEWKAFITRCVLLAAELGAGTKGNLYGQRDD